MSNSSDSRPRRKVAKYSSVERLTTAKNRFKFNPIDNKLKTSEKRNTTRTTTIHRGNTPGGSGTTDSTNQRIEEIINDETIEFNENDTMNMEEENLTSNNTNDTQGWQQVTKNSKGKHNAVNTGANKQTKETTIEEDIESITSYEDLNETQHSWREAFGAKKYKIWTYALRIPGKTTGDKIERIKRLFRAETEVITVTSEISNKHRMISAFFDSEEKMNKAIKLNVGINADQPNYMHRAAIFKRNPQREQMQGAKLWDIPIGMKYKELSFEISSVFGEIERMNLRTNDMWQSAVIIFKEKANAEKFLENWSIIIGDDSFRVTPLDYTAEDLKTRGKFTAKVIGLPIGITARELMPTISKVGALTCYFPRTRTYRRRGEAVISFASQETRDLALNASWTDDNTATTMKVVDFATKTCNRCYSAEHFIKDCPLTKRDDKYREKKANNIEKFGAIYKKYNPRYLTTLNRQTGNKTYADVTKQRRNINLTSNATADDRLSRIESLLEEVAERLVALEAHVWNKAEADIEQDEYPSDDDTDMDNNEEQDDENLLENTNKPKHSSNDTILSAINQLMARLDDIEKQVKPSNSTSGSTARVESGAPLH
jgi:hypothetical protein